MNRNIITVGLLLAATTVCLGAFAPKTALAVGDGDLGDVMSELSSTVVLAPGWNVLSTPRVLESHIFSAEETIQNFEIYTLDPARPSGYATMADLGQSEFVPLYGYYVRNKTGVNQTLTFNYKENLDSSLKAFVRRFNTPGWYLVGVANPVYARMRNGLTRDTDNPSNILGLFRNDVDSVIDFGGRSYSGFNRESLAVDDIQRAEGPATVNQLLDFTNFKGYAVRVAAVDTELTGNQDNHPLSEPVLPHVSAELSGVVSEGSGIDTNIEVAINEATSIPLVEFKLVARISDVDISTLDLDTSLVGEFVTGLSLVHDGVVVASTSTPTGFGASTKLELDNKITLVRDETHTFTVRADVVRGDTPGLRGSTLQVGVISVAGLESGSSDFSVVSTERLSGGLLQLESNGKIHASNFGSSATEVLPAEGAARGQLFSISYHVEAIGADFYIPKTLPGGLEYSLLKNGAATNDPFDASANTQSIDSSAETVTLLDRKDYYKIPDGGGEDFTVQILVSPNATPGNGDGMYAIGLLSIGFLDVYGQSQTPYQFNPSESFKTPEAHVEQNQI